MTIPAAGLASLEVLKRGPVTFGGAWYYWSNRWYTRSYGPAIDLVLARAYAQVEMEAVYSGYEVVSLRIAGSGVDNAYGTVVPYVRSGQLLPLGSIAPIIYAGVRLRLYVGDELVGYRVIRNGVADIWHTGGVWHDDYLATVRDNLVETMLHSTFPAYTAGGRQVTRVEIDRNLAQWPIRHGTRRATRTYWAE